MAVESKPIELGKDCPAFQLKGTDDRMYSLNNFKDSKVLVIGMTCNHCPYVQAYEGRLIRLVEAMKMKSVSFACINSNDSDAYPDDSFEMMKKRALEKGFNFHYLHDESQNIARAFNAECTPEFYVYDQDRKLRYHGRLDDSPKDPAAVKTTYLKDAIESLLADSQPPHPQTAAMGCSIKWKKASS